MSKGVKAHKLKNDPTAITLEYYLLIRKTWLIPAQLVSQKRWEGKVPERQKDRHLYKEADDSQNSKIPVAPNEKARVHIRLTISTQNIDKATNKNYFSQDVLYFKMLVMIKEEGSGTEMATRKCNLL